MRIAIGVLSLVYGVCFGAALAVVALHTPLGILREPVWAFAALLGTGGVCVAFLLAAGGIGILAKKGWGVSNAQVSSSLLIGGAYVYHFLMALEGEASPGKSFLLATAIAAVPALVVWWCVRQKRL